MDQVLFFGGNGHAGARLRPARTALARLVAAGQVAPVDLVEVPYPGFEDRPAAPDLPTFVSALEVAVREGHDAPRTRFAYATGIGALFALALRAEGALAEVPLVLQGPVLWGLERRWMPRAARAGLAPLIPRVFRWERFRRRFARRHFVVPPAPDVRDAFFDGYARCRAAADLFRWCGPAWLRHLESRCARRPESLSRVEVWWGARDAVVDRRELRWTEEALGVRWPMRTLPGWGHYPMIDDPEGWVRALAATVRAGGATIIGR